MSKMRSGRPANDRRSTRRSLVELTAAATRAIDEGLLMRPTSSGSVAASPEEAPRFDHVAKTPDLTAVAGQATVPTRVAAPERASEAAARGCELVASDSVAEMMVKIAKNYQNTALDDIKVSLNAALDYAKDFAEARVGSEGASKGRDDASPVKKSVTAVGGAAAEFRAEALELMKANMVTALEHAQELAGARTAAEFFELSGTQARKQCELILKQADALKSFARAVTKSAAK
jgi:hypothetical protein